MEPSSFRLPEPSGRNKSAGTFQEWLSPALLVYGLGSQSIKTMRKEAGLRRREYHQGTREGHTLVTLST